MLYKRKTKAFILENAENEPEKYAAVFFRKISIKSLCKINFVLNLHPHLSIGLSVPDSYRDGNMAGS